MPAQALYHPVNREKVLSGPHTHTHNLRTLGKGNGRTRVPNAASRALWRQNSPNI